MTGQINDSFFYKDMEYSVSAIEHPEKYFDFVALGINSMPPSTACWRGYVAYFAIDVKGHLVLRHLDTNNGNMASNNIPEINGKLPKIIKPGGLVDDYKEYRDLEYRDVDLPLYYSGAVLITDGFLHEFYVHQGFQSPMTYETVIELVFDNGLFTKENDVSPIALAIRNELSNHNEEDAKWGNLPLWICDRYDLSFAKRWNRG